MFATLLAKRAALYVSTVVLVVATSPGRPTPAWAPAAGAGLSGLSPPELDVIDSGCYSVVGFGAKVHTEAAPPTPARFPATPSALCVPCAVLCELRGGVSGMDPCWPHPLRATDWCSRGL